MYCISAGDILPPLYVLGAFVELRSAVSSRLVPLKRFIKGPGNTTIQKGEIAYGVWINKNQDYYVSHYERWAREKPLHCNCQLAAIIKLSDSGIIEKARFAWAALHQQLCLRTK
jgi:CO/xanthine dehydrogenase FAD-binding subunit